MTTSIRLKQNVCVVYYLIRLILQIPYHYFNLRVPPCPIHSNIMFVSITPKCSTSCMVNDSYINEITIINNVNTDLYIVCLCSFNNYVIIYVNCMFLKESMYYYELSIYN